MGDSVAINPRSLKKSRIDCITSWRTRRIAACRGERIHKCRWSNRNAGPCSFKSMGYFLLNALHDLDVFDLQLVAAGGALVRAHRAPDLQRRFLGEF
jgi:hypothetical protein